MNKVKEFIYEEDGIGVVEIILIVVILIGLVVIFRDGIEKLIKDIFITINERKDEL
jgi:Flp pilus assembly pilin Flp